MALHVRDETLELSQGRDPLKQRRISMSKFKVHVSRTGIRHAIVEVEAKDPLDAIVITTGKVDAGTVEFGPETECNTDVVGVTDEEKVPLPPKVKEMNRLLAAIDTLPNGPARDGCIAAFESLENQE
jgi:hypothetical protein